MFVELHLLQNFAPSNLNRDDTGSPKDCEFGAVRRARISSQCLKRATRTYFKDSGLLSADEVGTRTLRSVDQVSDLLVQRGMSKDEARTLVAAVLTGLGIAAVDDKGRGIRTEYLLFLGQREVQRLATFCDTHRVELAPLAQQYRQLVAQGVSNDDEDAEEGDSGKRRGKGINKKGLKKQLGEALKRSGVPADDFRRDLDGGRAVDVALFGRMLADLPSINSDGACQVAHAISTHKVGVEFDFYTAVDDLQTRDETGAGMMGTIEFNSACFYRYANVDVDQLRRNLDGDTDLVLRAIEAYLRASILAIPTGKQNSMAAQNLPALVLAVVRERGLWSLANAFERPARPTDDHGLVEESISKLDAQWGKLTRMYGAEGIRGVWMAQEEDVQPENLGKHQVGSVEELIRNVRAAVAGGGVTA